MNGQVSQFWQRLRRCKCLRSLQAVLRTERIKRESVSSSEAAKRFAQGAPVSGHPTKRMMVGKEFFTTDRYMKTYERADYRLARGNIDLFAARVIEKLRREGVPMYAHTVWRSPYEQRLMVSKGVSRTAPPVAAHCQGLAVDIVHAIYHWDLSPEEWRYIGNVGEAVARQMDIKVEWGGDWGADWSRGKRGWDPAHWQVAEWRSQADLTMEQLTRIGQNDPVRRCPRGVLRLGPKT